MKHFFTDSFKDKLQEVFWGKNIEYSKDIFNDQDLPANFDKFLSYIKYKPRYINPKHVNKLLESVSTQQGGNVLNNYSNTLNKKLQQINSSNNGSITNKVNNSNNNGKNKSNNNGNNNGNNNNSNLMNTQKLSTTGSPKLQNFLDNDNNQKNNRNNNENNNQNKSPPIKSNVIMNTNQRLSNKRILITKNQ